MDKLRKLYDRYRVYIIRQHLEWLALTVIVLSAIFVFTSGLPRKGVLSLENGAIHYDGSLVRDKMNGQGHLTFKNGDSYSGQFQNGLFHGQGTFNSAAGWKYEGEFVNGQAQGQGKLTTENKVVYEGTFKQGIYQNAH
ncbi:MORN repeat-containing protein [Streptococcus oricebi]|uniref:MORN repeat protein n=1 Tax=Streptococcus oricebi TaxID=1547447 RepID=A0ABS5B5T9_9STRE|nr:MORN repeat-containing protein [Streptococcus oricebi]MBP2624202.1 hypothetical protein [Streptococcus oricebi]